MIVEEKLADYAIRSNGILRYNDLLKFGFSKKEIKTFEENRWIERISRGIYYHKDYLADRMYVYQLENKYLIYSHETAAYLHGLCERYPRTYSVTTYSGYHLRKDSEFHVFYVKKALLEMGIASVKSNAGNILKVYDKERTLCDMVKNKSRIETQIYSETIQNYFKGNVKLKRLADYAKKLGISDQVLDIVNIMMKQ